MDSLKIHCQLLGNKLKIFGKLLGNKIKSFAKSTYEEFKTTGKEDPKRIVHSVKVGVSLTLVALLYLIQPIFQDLGKNVIWAIMTVVVVFENTAGSTLFKGFYRIVGTIGASICAFLVVFAADFFQPLLREIFIAGTVLFIGSVSSYVRYFPSMKIYDDAVSIWLLTFCLVLVSTYRAENVLKASRERIATIAIACGVCFFMTLIMPIWSGDQLHNSIASRIEKLSKLVQDCVCNYFKDDEEASNEPGVSTDANEYLDLMECKSEDETWALEAGWEPRFFKHLRSSCKEYITLGNSIRQLSAIVVALHQVSQRKTQAPKSARDVIRDPCMRLATEVSQALVKLSTSIKNRQHWSEDHVLSPNLRRAQEEVNTALDSLLVNNHPGVTRVGRFVCVLEQVAELLEEAVDQARSLATIARFKAQWYDVDEQPEIIGGGDEENQQSQTQPTSSSS